MAFKTEINLSDGHCIFSDRDSETASAIDKVNFFSCDGQLLPLLTPTPNLT